MKNIESSKLGGEFHSLTTLKKGERYTLLLMSEFGIGAVSLKITLEDVRVSEYAQYLESVQLIFKLKGKRSLRGIRFHGSKSVAIWLGWIDINTDVFEAATTSEHGLVCRKSRYLSYDNRYMTEAIASTKASPVFSRIV